MGVLYFYKLNKDSYATDYRDRINHLVAARYSLILYFRWIHSSFTCYSSDHHISSLNTSKKTVVRIF